MDAKRAARKDFTTLISNTLLILSFLVASITPSLALNTFIISFICIFLKLRHFKVFMAAASRAKVTQRIIVRTLF